ncbi:MAG: hypothetical protein GF418_14590 [Chitinivibrionales bacterium]|nr:hypothetical protein [Chitinivibrionales bacterium]MBD3396848.1 hypothetical protein [Chitinivibrionales bacterium]
MNKLESRLNKVLHKVEGRRKTTVNIRMLEGDEDPFKDVKPGQEIILVGFDEKSGHYRIGADGKPRKVWGA